MEPTILNTLENSKRYCTHCGVSYEGGNAKRKFCSDNCRVAHHRHRQTTTILQQSQKVDEQSTIIEELTNAPVRRTESVRIVNPNWAQANQSYLSQQSLCDSLKSQLTKLNQDNQALQSGDKGAYIGMAVGIALSLIWITDRCDDRNSIRTTDIIRFGVMVILLSMCGYFIGGLLHRTILADDPKIIDSLEDTASQSEELKEKIKTEQAKEDEFLQKLNQLSRYDKETETSFDEVRIHDLVNK